MKLTRTGEKYESPETLARRACEALTNGRWRCRSIGPNRAQRRAEATRKRHAEPAATRAQRFPGGPAGD